jgi:hypothetical protein
VSEDENRRRRERENKVGNGSGLDLARGEADVNRLGLGLEAYYSRFIGTKIYAETFKMNYRGTLTGVIKDAMGSVTHLLVHPLWRVGDWEDQPNPQFEECMEGSLEHPHALLVEGICDFGLQQKHWRDGPKPGPRS